jgi:hypothetical protein
MTSSQQRPTLIFSLILAGVIASAGCHPHASSQQIPSPVKVAVADGNGYLVFYRWEGGPAVMICCDVKPDATGQEENGGGPPWHRMNSGYVGSQDGRKVAWRFETTDNRQIETQINGADRDLNAGNVFLVTTLGGATVVEQVKRDLSAVAADAESVKACAAGDEGMRKVLGVGGSNSGF